MEIGRYTISTKFRSDCIPQTRSDHETYQDNLKSAAIIGKVIGKEAEMTQRLQQHTQRT